MANVQITKKEFDELVAAGMPIPSVLAGSPLENSFAGRSLRNRQMDVVDPNILEEYRAKLKALKSNVSAQSTAEAQDPRRANRSMLGGDSGMSSGYSLLSPAKKGNTLLG